MSINIKQTSSLSATVLVDVDLTEWGKYPDDNGVLTRAITNITDSMAAITLTPQRIQDAIDELQDKKDNLEDLKPIVDKLK